MKRIRVSDLGERRLIKDVRRQFGRRIPGVVLGIGDDAAVVRGPEKLLLTTDILVEDRDFRKALHPPFLLGRKSLNVSLSDIAAMGGKPLHALVGLVLPGDTEERWVEDFLAGIKSAARESGVALVGGDFSEGGEIVISVTVTGKCETFIPRSGAKPGDGIFVSGTLGDAAQGLLLVESGCRLGNNKSLDRLIRAFLDPAPRLALGAALARRKLASAMIDISDGLAVDLSHICEESRVGAEIELSRIPISAAQRQSAKDPLRVALAGGEDFELLFTVKEENAGRVRRLAGRVERMSGRAPITRVGRITRGSRIIAIDEAGRKKPLAVKGWEHFR